MRRCCFVKRELVPDCGGAGKYRGGLAQEISIKVMGRHDIYVSTSSERIKNPPRGYLGGKHGAAGALTRGAGDISRTEGTHAAETGRNRDRQNAGRRRLRRNTPARSRSDRERTLQAVT